MSGPRGLQLSGSQIIASVLATLTGAVAASYLGVAGTLVGAAVGSIASTLGTAVYKHYLERSQERLRAAGQVLYQSAGRTRTGKTTSRTGAGAGGGRHAASGGPASQQGAGRDEAERDTAVWDRRQYGAPRDPHETQMIPGLATQSGGAPNGGTSQGGSADGGTTDGGSPNGGTAANGGSQSGDTAGHHAHGNLSDEGPTGDGADRGSLWGAFTSFFGNLTRRQWLTYGGIAAGFFLVVVAGITVFELASGKQLGQAVYGGHSSPQLKQTTHPASTPSATPSATPSGSTSATPTSSSASSSASGTPTPGSSGTASSPSTVPSPTPSTGSSGAARSTTTTTTTITATPTP